MDNNAGALEVRRNHVREWIDPRRLYDTRVPAGRLIFLWGLVGYPLLVMFIFETAAIIIMMSLIPSTNVGDDIGIVSYIFMLGWVAATVAIVRRRLLDVGKSLRWVWLSIFPIISLPLYAYLLLKAGPTAAPEATSSFYQ